MNGSKRKDPIRSQLEAWAGGQLAPGQEIKGVLSADGLEIEVLATVRRRAEPDAVKNYRAAALEHLAQNHHLVWHCGCSVSKKRAWGGTGTDDCKVKISAAIVYQSFKFDFKAPVGQQSQTTNAFRFVCNRHRESHSVDKAKILAVVELPPSSYAAILAEAQAERAKRDSERRLEEDTRDAVRDVLEQLRPSLPPPKNVLRLVEADRLPELPPLDPKPPRLGDEVEVDACSPGEAAGQWVRARVSEIRSNGFVANDEHGRAWSREFVEGRWRTTGCFGPPEASAAMELLRFNQPVDILTSIGERDGQGRPLEPTKWRRATVDGFRVGGFYWKHVDAAGRAHFGVADLAAGGDAWRFTAVRPGSPWR